ncbi:MAG: heavy metal-binding domain-containing protein [bacterium]
MIITTTSSVEGKQIMRYLGIVAGEAVTGSNLVDDLLRSLKGIMGGSVTKLEKSLLNARTMALKQMEKRAADLGANAVVAVDLDYQVLSAGEIIMMVIANGTAVEVA